jgi:Kef-type K+ transport system membrane component KefB
MTLIENLCLLLIGAHLLGWLASRTGLPELLGHLTAGVMLGPATLNWVSTSSALNAFADLSVLLVVITAGLEMRLNTVIPFFRGRSVLALLPGIVLPASAGFVLALCFAYSRLGATVVALCMAVTALPVALRILSSFGLLGTRLAQLTIAGALLADVLVLLVLGVLLAQAQSSDRSNATLLGLGALKLLTFVALLGACVWACKRLYRRLGLQPRGLAGLALMIALLLILGLAAAADALGLHFAIGAFLGALMVSEYLGSGSAPHPLQPQLQGMSNMIFAPLFLACQGLHFTTTGLAHPAFAVWLVLAAITSKLAGGYWGARLYGLSRHEARGTAIVMNARGVMEMVVASIAFNAGLVDQTLFSTLLMVGMFTALLTPLLLKHWQRQPQITLDGASTPPEP